MQNNVFYFIGIGGIGMSSIARYLLELGAQVGGYDLTPSAITSSLQDSGAFITFDEQVEALPDLFKARETLVIYTPAIPSSHKQLLFFEKQGNSVKKRAAFLGEITNSMTTLAVAGTHGKTTTTSILAHFFLSLQSPFTAFVGGMMNAHKSNLIVISGHYDCAGNPVSEDEHISHIKKSAEIISSWDLNVKVIGVWVNSSWNVQMVYP